MTLSGARARACKQGALARNWKSFSTRSSTSADFCKVGPLIMAKAFLHLSRLSCYSQPHTLPRVVYIGGSTYGRELAFALFPPTHPEVTRDGVRVTPGTAPLPAATWPSAWRPSLHLPEVSSSKFRERGSGLTFHITYIHFNREHRESGKW